MKQYPQTVGFVDLTVRLVVWTPLLTLTPAVWAFHRLYKKKHKPKNKQRVERKNWQIRIYNCKTYELKSGTFKHSSMYLSWLTRELCESPTQLLKMLTHLAIVFIALCLDSILRTDCFSAPNCSLRDLTPNWTDPLLHTDCFSALNCSLGVSPQTD